MQSRGELYYIYRYHVSQLLTTLASLLTNKKGLSTIADNPLV